MVDFVQFKLVHFKLNVVIKSFVHFKLHYYLFMFFSSLKAITNNNYQGILFYKENT